MCLAIISFYLLKFGSDLVYCFGQMFSIHQRFGQDLFALCQNIEQGFVCGLFNLNYLACKNGIDCIVNILFLITIVVVESAVECGVDLGPGLQ